jgi:hypothetical protein
MQKNAKIFLIAFLILVIVGFVFFAFKDREITPRNLSKITDQEIIGILKKDKDIKEYIQKYPDFKIENKEVLTRESILVGQNAQSLQQIYQDLEFEDNRYIKVQLMDLAGQNGFFGVIDFKNNSVIKAFGILLFKASAESIKK